MQEIVPVPLELKAFEEKGFIPQVVSRTLQLGPGVFSLEAEELFNKWSPEPQGFVC